MSVELAIDWTRCDGHGLCAELMPEAIKRDEWGFPIIDRAAAARATEATLKRVVSVCPALALRLEATSSSATATGSGSGSSPRYRTAS